MKERYGHPWEEERSGYKEKKVECLKRLFEKKGVEMVFFDMDSTLVKTFEAFDVKLWKYAEWMNGETGVDREEIRESLGEVLDGLIPELSVRPEKMAVAASMVARWYGIDLSGANGFERELGELMDTYHDPVERCFGSREQLGILMMTGMRMGVVTHADEDWNRVKIRKNFPGLLNEQYCVDVAKSKDKKAWQGAGRYFGVDMSRVIVVGDSLQSDVIPALEAGVGGVVWVNCSTLGKETLMGMEGEERAERIESIRMLSYGLEVLLNKMEDK